MVLLCQLKLLVFYLRHGIRGKGDHKNMGFCPSFGPQAVEFHGPVQYGLSFFKDQYVFPRRHAQSPVQHTDKFPEVMGLSLKIIIPVEDFLKNSKERRDTDIFTDRTSLKVSSHVFSP